MKTTPPPTSDPGRFGLRRLWSAACTALFLLVPTASRAADYTHVRVGVPSQTGSSVQAMDNDGRIATTSLIRSFLFADRFHTSYVEITNVNVATSTPGLIAQGLNDLGDVVGRYRTNGLPANQTRGFIRRANGTFEPFDYPGVASTSISEINNHGHIVGETRSDLTSFGLIRGFVHTNGVSAEIHFPGAVLSRAYGVNDAGDIVGQYQLEDAVSRPFLLRNGVYSQIVPTNAPGGLASGIAFSISDNGLVLGTYRDLANVSKTWVMRADGSFEYPALPGTGRVINSAGQIAGSFADTNNANASTPYVATPVPVLPSPLAFTFEIVAAALPGATETLLSDIDNDGRLVGRFKNNLGVSQGLLIDGATQTNFNITGTTATFPGGFNSLGTVAGFYHNATNPAVQHGFLRATNGTVTTIDGTVPGTTYVWRVNDRGEANGYWFEESPFFIRSFRRDTNGALTTFVYPGSPVGTVTRGMNEAGDLAGWKWNDNYELEGVVFKRDSTTNVFTVSGWANTLPGDINNHGDIAGTVINAAFNDRRGFFRRANGETVVFAPPMAIETEVFGLNDKGEIVGEYVLVSGERFGFIARPAARLERGHVDAGLAYENGELEFHLHDEENDVEYGVTEAVVAVGTAAEQAVSDELAFAFLGRPGYSTWVLPSVQNESLPFLGLAAEEIATGVFANDRLTVELVFVQGAGEFALYTLDAFGQPVVHINTADGYDESDIFVLQAGSHQHVNWAFSAPGTYRVGLRARGTLVEGGGEVVGEAFFYTFTVPDALRVQPEEPVEEIYTITDIGMLGGASSFALDVNESAQVTGNARYTNTNTRLHAFAWNREIMRDLGYLTNGVEFSRGYAINDSGHIVGESDNDVSKAFLWDGTNMVQLGTLGGASAVEHDINNAGEIVGASSNGSASRPYKRSASGVMQDLGTLLGTANSSGRAWSLNAAGTVVGLSRNAANTTSQATLWIGGSISNLGSLAGGAFFSQAYAINDSNVVVGSSVVGKVSPSSSTDLYHAFVWTNGVMVDLGAHPTNPEYIHSEAKDVNNAGAIVGYASKFSGNASFGGAAMLWRNGQAIDLNTLVPPGSGWVLQTAEGINDRGDIVGSGTFQGQTRAYLLRRATIYTQGHADFAFDYENGQWNQRMRNDELGADLEPATILVRGEVASQLVVPAELPPGYEFLGNAGDTIWMLPEVQDPRLPFLGLAAEETAIDVFANRSIPIRLLAVQGPGQFTASDEGSFAPRVFFNTKDGIGSTDEYPLTAGSHAHLNWGFYAPGYYRITLQPRGTLANGGAVTVGDPITFHFQLVAVETALGIARTETGLRIAFQTQKGVNYELKRAAQVNGPYDTLVGQPFTGTGLLKEISLPAAAGNAFYRIEATIKN
jgi:surface-anchored protein